MTNYKPLSDDELIGLIKAGSAAAFAEFYLRYSSILLKHAYKVLKDDEDARDVVQDIFGRIWESRASLMIRSSVRAYLFKAARHQVIDSIRRRKTIGRYLDSLEFFQQKYGRAADEILMDKQLLEWFDKEMEALTPRVREAFSLRIKEGLSNKEVGHQLNITENTVKKQVGFAIKHLRLKLSQLFMLLFL